jgi:hypothetical protein
MVYLTNICHLWVVARSWKRCNIDHLPVSWLGICDWGNSSESAVFVYLWSRASLRPHDLFILRRQTHYLCVDWVPLGSMVEWGGGSSTLVVRRRSHCPVKYLTSLIECGCLQNKPVVGTYDSCSLGSLYTSCGNAVLIIEVNPGFNLIASSVTGCCLTL